MDVFDFSDTRLNDVLNWLMWEKEALKKHVKANDIKAATDSAVMIGIFRRELHFMCKMNKSNVKLN